MSRLFRKAQEIVEDSTAHEARGFDTAAWLKRWVLIPQPALCGRPPADLLGSKEGEASVIRVLGALRSGAYQ